MWLRMPRLTDPADPARGIRNLFAAVRRHQLTGLRPGRCTPLAVAPLPEHSGGLRELARLRTAADSPRHAESPGGP